MIRRTAGVAHAAPRVDPQGPAGSHARHDRSWIGVAAALVDVERMPDARAGELPGAAHGRRREVAIALGGVKRLREGRNMDGVPILNKIPYVSRLFKNTGVGRELPARFAQCLEHLNTTGRAYLPAFDEGIADAVRRGLYGSGPFRYNLIGRLMARSMEPPPRFKAPESAPPLRQEGGLQRLVPASESSPPECGPSAAA